MLHAQPAFIRKGVGRVGERFPGRGVCAGAWARKTVSLPFGWENNTAHAGEDVIGITGEAGSGWCGGRERGSLRGRPAGAKARSLSRRIKRGWCRAAEVNLAARGCGLTMVAMATYLAESDSYAGFGSTGTVLRVLRPGGGRGGVDGVGRAARASAAAAQAADAGSQLMLVAMEWIGGGLFGLMAVVVLGSADAVEQVAGDGDG